MPLRFAQKIEVFKRGVFLARPKMSSRKKAPKDQAATAAAAKPGCVASPGVSGNRLQAMVQVRQDLLVSDFSCIVCREAAVNKKGELTYINPCGHLLCTECFPRPGSKRACPLCRKSILELSVLPPFLRCNPLLKPPKQKCPDCKTEYLGKRHFKSCPERKAVYQGALVSATQVLDLVAKVTQRAPDFGSEGWRFDFSDGDRIVFDFKRLGQLYRMVIWRLPFCTLFTCLTLGPKSIYIQVQRSPWSMSVPSRYVYIEDGEFGFFKTNASCERLKEVVIDSIKDGYNVF